MQLRDAWKRGLSWLGRHELGSVLALGALATGSWIFIEVAEEVMEGETRAIDRALLLGLRNPANLSDPIGPLWLEEAIRDCTALGGVALLSLVSLAVIAQLILSRKPKAAGFVAASVLGALVVSLALKSVFARPRPDLVPQLSHVASTSFPSGHSMLSAAVYLTLGWSILLTLLVGFSRVYTGVHWPSDVLAGWAAGAAWAGLCWVVARALQRRGHLEIER
jgi:undecaprenyl-diphosphatase